MHQKSSWRPGVPDRSKPDRRELLFNLFERRVYGESFKDLSGWDRLAIAQFGTGLRVELSESDLRRYFFDRELSNEPLENIKDEVVNLLSMRDRTLIDPDNLLLTPGATSALSVILHFFRANGVEVVLTDPPFYFSIEKLCLNLGIRFHAVPRTAEELGDDDRIVTLVNKYRGARKAVILTQPRYVISRNYPSEIFTAIQNSLARDDFLVLDQSVDMEFQNKDNFMSLESSFIKVRTIGKALGLNGSRLATITAAENVIVKLNRHAGVLYGSLDVAMLKLGSLIAQCPASFESYLHAMRCLVEERVLEARSILSNPMFELVSPKNGFLGYALIDTSSIGRFSLYQSLLRENVHAMFSEHIGLRRSYRQELIRINYLLDNREALQVLQSLGSKSLPLVIE